MNTSLAAPARRSRPVDVLFTSQSKGSDIRLPASLELQIQALSGKSTSGDLAFMGDVASEAVPGIARLGMTRDQFISPTEKAANKVSQDIYLTQRILPPMIPRNVPAASLRLLERIEQSTAGMWRNPLQMIIKNWKRRELLHVFNGFFHAAIDDPERYDTFSRNVTWPTMELG